MERRVPDLVFENADNPDQKDALSNTQREEFKQAFDAFDVDHSGTIDTSELRSVLEQ